VFLICRSCWGDDKEWLVRHLQKRFVSIPAVDPSVLLNCEKTLSVVKTTGYTSLAKKLADGKQLNFSQVKLLA
jgi:hypothetical protein